MTSINRPPRVGTPHPGLVIRAWLQRNGQKQAWLAEQLRITEKHLNRIIRGHALYSADIAVRLESVTGLAAKDLMRMRADYELAQAQEQRP